MRWAAETLGDVVQRDGGLIQTGPFGSQLHESDYVADGIPVIMPKDISDGRVDVQSVARVSEGTANRLSRHQLIARTIVLPRRGAITKRAYIRESQTGWLCGTGCLQIKLDGNRLVPEFLYYFMELQEIARWLEQHAVGTTMLNLSAGIVKELPLRYPTVALQRQIADVLTSYDDSIENNRRRMALLEDAARQLYREWFVRLRFPGHEPTRIIDGLPEGWGRRHLETLCVSGDGIQTGPFGSQLHQSDYSDEGIPVVMPKDLIGFRIVADATSRIPEDLANKLDRHRMIVGDTVYGRRGDIGRRAYIGPRQAGWFCGTGCLRIRPDSASVNPRFLFDALGAPETAGAIANRAKGATMANLNATLLRTVPIVVADRKVQELYATEVDCEIAL